MVKKDLKTRGNASESSFPVPLALQRTHIRYTAWLWLGLAQTPFFNFTKELKPK